MMGNWGYNNPLLTGMLGTNILPAVFLLWPFIILDLVLKGFALYYSARKGDRVWFIVILIVNSLGIIPAIYLFLNRKHLKK